MSRGTKVVPYTGPVEVYVPELHPGQLKIKKNRRRFTVVRCGRRFGKALALDTPIPTPSGWTTMGELQAGDTVFDEQGLPCTVVYAHEVMHGRPCYKVTFSGGETVVADEGHLWSVRRAGQKHARVLETRTIAEHMALDEQFVIDGPKEPHAIFAIDPVESVPVRCITVDSPNRLYLCSRSFIPTHNTVYGKAEALEVALKGGKVGWVSPNNKLATEVWRDLVRRLRGLTDQEGGRVSEMERRIELPEGGVIEVWSSHDNSDIARGRDYDLVVVDEAGLIPDLSVLWDSALAPTLADRQGAGLLLGTPKGLRTAFNVMFADAETGEDPEWAAFNAPTTDNTTLPGLVLEVEKACRRAERRGTLALWTQEYLGIPADDGSNPFGLDAIARVATTAVRVKENELYPQWRPEGPARPAIAWGVDLARSIDYTVAIGFDELGRWCDCHRFQADWKLTKNRLIDIIGFDTPVIMDATGVGSPIVQDLYNAGLQVSPFVFTYRSRNKLVEELITGIHGARMSLPNNFVRTEMETVGVEQTSIGPRYTVPQGHHDDGLMAIGLAWMCFQNYAGMPDWPAEREVIHPRKDTTKFLPAAKPHEDESDFEILGSGW